MAGKWVADAPVRPPLDWNSPQFWDEGELLAELERVFDICDGCRRCHNLCNAFPTLFELIDESTTGQLSGVSRHEFWKVVANCHLCDQCYSRKCPYVSPHEWRVDFPRLMLRARMVRYRNGGVGWGMRLLASPETLGRVAALPLLRPVINAAMRSGFLRRLAGVHPDAVLPPYQRNTVRRLFRNRVMAQPVPAPSDAAVVLFASCYGNYQEAGLIADLIAVFEHNGITVVLTEQERCCAMRHLEMGDLAAVERSRDMNIPMLADWVEHGWSIVAPVPSCGYLFRQGLPSLFPSDPRVRKVAGALFDPFEYLAMRHDKGCLKTDFRHPLGVVLYQQPCHLEAQRIGMQSCAILSLVPQTHVEPMVRCCGHGGSHAIRAVSHRAALAMATPIVERIRQIIPEHYCSDCPMAGRQLESGLADGSRAEHPVTLLRRAYGI